jgi:tripeptidyl-peptidase-1
MLQSLLAFAALLVPALSFPASNLVLHEKRDEPYMGLRERVEPDSIIPIRIALRQNNLETGYDRLMDVSHPSSSNYGKHLSAEDVHDIFAPSEETLQIVKEWLLSSGIEEDEVLHFTNKGWLAVDIPAHHAEKLFATEYYEHEFSNSMRIGCDSYHLPAHVSEHIDFVKPGVAMSAPMKKRKVKRDEAGWPGPWPRPPHGPPHPWPHWQPPPHAKHLPPDLQACSVNIT